MARIVKHWPAALAALISLAAFPPLSLELLILVALVPWIAFLKSCSRREAWQSGYVYGALFMLGQLWFIQKLAITRTNSLPLSLLPWLIGVALLAFFFAFLGYLIWKSFQLSRPFLMIFAWVGVEVFRTYLPNLGFPVGLLGVPLNGTLPIANLAWYGSIFLVSGWVASVNLLGAMILTAEPMSRSRALLIPIVIGVVLGTARYLSSAPGQERVVTIGQPGVDFAFQSYEAQTNALKSVIPYLQEKAKSHKSELLVLPEGVTRLVSVPPRDLPYPLGGVPLLFGAQRGDGDVYQSAIAYDGEWKFADKRRLVIFGEFVPLRNVIPFLKEFQLGADLRAAESTKSLKIGKLNVGPMICFENLFPDVAAQQCANGAQILAVLSNDDWFFGTPLLKQLRDVTVFRAIESGLPVVRSSPNGFSIAVDARGNVVQEAPLKQPAALDAHLVIPERADRCPVSDLVPYLGLIALFVIPLWPIRQKEQLAPELER